MSVNIIAASFRSPASNRPPDHRPRLTIKPLRPSHDGSVRTTPNLLSHHRNQIFVGNCPNCGKPYPEGPDAGRYCEYCGYDLGAPAPSAQPAIMPTPPKPTRAGARGSRTVLVVFFVIVVVLVAAFGYYYVQSSGTISSQESQISAQLAQLSAKESQLSAKTAQLASDNATITNDNARIANLTSIVSSFVSKVSSLQSEVTTDQAKVSSLTSRDAQANKTIDSLNTQIGSLQSQISTLNGQVASDQSQISSLQSQVSSLQDQVSSLQAQLTQLRGFVSSVNNALTSSGAQLYLSDYSFSEPTGYYHYWNLVSGNSGGYLVVSVVSSTSPDTIINSSINHPTVDVGSAGVAVFGMPASTGFTLSIYDKNYESFSATVNIWYFFG